MQNDKFEIVEKGINEWTWQTLSWLPDDCDEGYPIDPDNYQINDAMQEALETVKRLTIECIKKHDDYLVMLRPETEAAHYVWDKLEDQIDELGDYGQTDTASREAFMYAIDKFYQ